MEKASKEKEMFLPPILRTVFPSLTKSGKRIALYIAAHEEEVKRMTLGELAHAIDISEITILRFCKQLGFVGFQELKVELASGRGEATNFLGYDLVEATDTPQQISQKVIANIINGLQDTLQLLDQAALKEAITALFEARQTLILGFGNSATVCRDMETRLFSFANGKYFTFFTHFDKRFGKFLNQLPTWHNRIIVEVVKMFIRYVNGCSVIMRCSIGGISVSMA